MSDDEPPTRAELIAARDRLKAQLAVLVHPIRNRSPQLIARLRTMIDDIDACLAALDASDA